MTDAELDRVSLMLGKARSPEEVFGTLTGTRSEMLDTARKIFRQMAKVVHPDSYQGTAEFARAEASFKLLTRLWEQAQAKIERGTYGTPDTTASFEPFILNAGARHYTVERLLTRGDLCNLYISTFTGVDKKEQVIIKVPVKPGDNDLVANEARVLGHLCENKEYEKCRHFVSQLVDHFSYHEKETGAQRNVNVISYIDGFYSLKEVKEVYQGGIDPKDMAWIWRRLLVALSFAHTNHVIHGAVLPTHILIHPEQHGVVLIDWSYAVLYPETSGERISAISSMYREWYPVEVFAKQQPTPALDIAMAGKCMIDLLGGDPHKRTMPAIVPWQVQNFLRACTIASPNQRAQDAYQLLEDFDNLIGRLYGPRKFHKFTMPER